MSGGVTGIDGEAEAIVRAQHGSERYLQRPDADYVEVDSSRTSMSGAKGTILVRKISGEHWLWDVFLDAESPELTFNDIGRIRAADGIMTRQGLTYRETVPGQALRGYSFSLGHTSEWNYGGDRQQTTLRGDTELTLNNFWTARASTSIGLRSQNQRLTRGGPSMQGPRSWDASLSIQSNPSAQTRWSIQTSYGRDEVDGWSGSLGAEIALVPAPRWQISFVPSFERLVDSRQYVTTLDGGTAATYGGRYVFGYADRTTIALETRLNFTLQPDLNLELYAQPFAASGRYFDIGELAEASGLHLRTYGSDGTTATPLPDGDLEVMDGADTFTVPNQDFNLRSFRSTLVLSWEWRPGSTLFLVWQQARSRELDVGNRSGLDDLFGSLGTSGDNFFAVKASYWIGL